MNRMHINPLQWHTATGVARQICARVFRDGGAPADAVSAFGLTAESVGVTCWSKAVEAIAQRICQGDMRKAA